MLKAIDLILGDIIAPQSPLEGLRPEMLTARTQALENEIRASKQRHEENLHKFKTSCKVWKEGTKRLTMNPNPIQDILATRVDGVAAAAKDAESAVSLAMTQASSTEEVEEINREVLAQCGVPNARIRKIQRVRPVGKHIEYQPAKKHVTAPPRPSVVRSPAKPVAPALVEDKSAVEVNQMELEIGDDGHANEAFEAMEAMGFDADAEFGSLSENHDDMTMDMGVD